jgi:hypothetical protein
MPDRIFQRLKFELNAQVGDVREVSRRHRRNCEAAVRLRTDKSLGKKMQERLPQGSDTGLIAIAEVLELEPIVRLEYAGNDVLTDLPEHVE